MEQRLIDANKILYHQVWKSGSMEPANESVALMSEVQAMPTIDPETLPIVHQFRDELARVMAERDAAVRDMHHNTKCFICAHLPADGNMSHCKRYAACGLGYIHWKWRGPQKEE